MPTWGVNSQLATADLRSKGLNPVAVDMLVASGERKDIYGVASWSRSSILFRPLHSVGMEHQGACYSVYFEAFFFFCEDVKHKRGGLYKMSKYSV